MLRELYIENLAVIEQMNIIFDQGFMVFTGETGAGKSIVIDAMNFILGQRVGRDMIRASTQKAHVTAIFQLVDETVKQKLAQMGFEFSKEEKQLMVSREINLDGRSQARLMGRPVTVSVLKEIIPLLINIHGQHDNQMLLQSHRHIDILDAYADKQGLLEDYKTAYKLLVEYKKKFKKIQFDQQKKEHTIEMLTYQIDEIDRISPKAEEEDLSQQVKLMRSSDQMVNTLSKVHELLCGNQDHQGGLMDQASHCCTMMQLCDGKNELITQFTEQLSGVHYELQDISENIQEFLTQFEFDPVELEQLEYRLDQLSKLKRKYGATIADILAFRDQAQIQLDQIEQSDQQTKTMMEKLEQYKNQVILLAGKLSKARQQAAVQFEQQTAQQLKDLDMPNISFIVKIQQGKYTIKGQDEVEILFSTNPGEPPRNISKVASGGELSRMMLAFKAVMSHKDQIQTLVFDEIDVGVSGQSAQKIGLKLKQVAAHKQVLCVTHSAQIAALSDHHFLVEKKTKNERTFANIVPLTDEKKIQEVARIMSTGTITPLLLKNAEQMVQASKKIISK